MEKNAIYNYLIDMKDPKQKRVFINTMNGEQIKGLEDLVISFLRKKIKLPPSMLKKLRKDRLFMGRLLDKNVNLNLKRQALNKMEKTLPYIIKQKGGMGAVSSLVMPMIAKTHSIVKHAAPLISSEICMVPGSLD